MRVILNEEGLKVNKFNCNSVTIYKENNIYIAELFDIEGYTERKVLKDNLGNKYFKTLRLKKKIKSNTFDYSGIELKKCCDRTGRYNIYSHAINLKKEYINYYEK